MRTCQHCGGRDEWVADLGHHGHFHPRCFNRAQEEAHDHHDGRATNRGATPSKPSKTSITSPPISIVKPVECFLCGKLLAPVAPEQYPAIFSRPVHYACAAHYYLSQKENENEGIQKQTVAHG